MQVVRGHLQAYDWGPVDGLVPWTPATGGPQAELWFGTHDNGPSPLRDGAGVAGGDLPVLVKLLAAARPLSIQIHPSARLAAAHLARQEQDSHAAHLVSDPHGKAEMLIALRDFEILEGFRDTRTSAAVFDGLGRGLAAVARPLHDGDLPAAVRAALAVPPDVVREQAPELPAAFLRAGLPQATSRTMAEVVRCYPRDPGVFVAALLNVRTLAPGEAVYVDPGTVHAYVRGLGLEVMNSSDNVLRLGLTSKVVAVDAALEALDVTAQPHPCRPQERDGVRRYAPQGAPFAVEVLRSSHTVAHRGRARTVVCLEGTADVGPTRLGPGEAVLLDAGDASVTVAADGRAVVAWDANDTAYGRG